MKAQFKLAFFISGVIFLSINFVQGVELLQKEKIIIPDSTSDTVKIDGDLNENVWNNAPLSKEFVTYYPVFGEGLGRETKIWLAYNSKTLYFAFKCYDNEPKKIKTSISQRDNISKDDWIGIALDAQGNKQTCYEFYINPSGIQSDSLYTAINGSDRAPDFVWESAGKLTDFGYQLEVAVPLKSIRFKSGKEVGMGIIFFRKISRLGACGAWPEMGPGQTEFNYMLNVIYKNLKKGLNMEVLPNFTYSKDVQRENADTWGDSDISTNIGAAFKYGLTSAITAEATINPDFSQVESDAYQVEVNRRYPIFYSEKRPFFMEGMDVFDFGIISNGMMISAVHTRRIVDPGWAAKLSGTSGKVSFAVLAANDKSPGQPRDDEGVNPNEGREAFFGIARAKYNIGSDNSIGILYSGRHFAGGKNDVIGADLQYRLFKNARISLSYFHSNTREDSDNEPRNGNGVNAMFQYLVPKFTFMAAYERYDKDFFMATAFQNRTNLSRGWIYVGPRFDMKIKKLGWLRHIHPYIKYAKLHDPGTKMDDTNWTLGLNISFTRQAYIIVEYRNEKEAWLNKLYDQYYFYSVGIVQLFKWLNFEMGYWHGDLIYYGPEEPCLGLGENLKLKFIFQPVVRFNLNAEFIHNELYRKTDDREFYSVNIYNIKAIYQFNKYFFIRGVVRYDDFQKKLLTDFLASFTLIPGTVMHLGYGELYERKEWQNNQWVPGQGGLLGMKRGLFFKISYLWQIK